MFAKLFSSITESSLWSEPKEVRLLFVTMLAKSDQNGFVEASILGLARVANLTLEETERSLDCLMSPDPYSKNPDNEGRRVLSVPGGFVLLNYDDYRQRRSTEERREYMREYMKTYRKKQADENKTELSKETVNRSKPKLAYTEKETEAEAETRNKKDVSFDLFWEAFPRGRKTGKGKAKVAFLRAIKKVDAETIISAAKEYAASDVGRGQFVKGPEPWIDGECWEDDREAWKDKEDRQPASQERVIFNRG